MKILNILMLSGVPLSLLKFPNSTLGKFCGTPHKGKFEVNHNVIDPVLEKPNTHKLIWCGSFI